jgi:uncharacterized membrane protein (UPF0127 family)/CheY-like chemotaxis protein
MAAEAKVILNLTRSTIVCERGVVADRPLRRLRGLVGRSSLPAGEGMLLRPAPSIHTAFMRFPIDAVFMDREMRVIKVVEALRPWRVASAPRARGVLELAAGEAALREIEVGDQLGVFELDSTYIGAGRNGPTNVLRGGPAQAVSPTSGQSKPARVLVLAGDRRFRAVSAALLTRRGCAVVLAERTAGADELARRERAEVVILDASSLTAAEREVSQLAKLKPPVGVVVVGDESGARLSAMPVIAKWDSFEAIWEAIERVRPDRAREGHGGRG